MSRQLRQTLIAVPILAVAVFLGAVLMVRAVRSGEIPPGVTAQGIDLGGLGEDDARTALLIREAQLLANPAVFIVKGSEFALDPRAVGLDLDEDAVVEKAFAVPRTGLFGGGDPVELDVPITLDPALLEGTFQAWETTALPDKAYSGAVVVRDGRAIPDYPRTGEAIKRTEANGLVLKVLSSTQRLPTELPLEIVQPLLSDGDIEAAVEEANLVIANAITLASEDPEIEVVFTSSDLATALRSEVFTESTPTMKLWFDPIALAPKVEPMRDTVEVPPRDAGFDVDEETDRVTIVPSRPGTLLDMDLLASELYQLALSGSRAADFPFKDGAPPSFTTEQAEAMEPLGLVSKFSTSFPAGQPRVTNIHLMAATVDGAVVYPGDEFSLNEYVGQRTEEEGYLPAPMILRGEIVDDVGGGVSQFATTFYNAVFYGCYEDVSHKPHSYYFDRYPEVNEATISWPQPDLIFRNDSDAVVIIRTDRTSTSVAVKFYGNNGGKTCIRKLGSRYDLTEPDVEYLADASVPPGQEIVEERGFGGFSNSVIREMTMPDGTVIEQSWNWRYQPGSRVIRVHPCKVPGSSQVCPVVVPSVVGKTFEDAAAALQGAGFAVVKGETVAVETEAEDGLVASQAPGSGTYAAPGTTITVRLGVFTPPEPPPDEPPPEEPPPEE